MTHIDFERSSGLVGRRINYSVDLDDLPVHEAQNLERLVSEANFFELPENLHGSATPDEFQYQLTIEDGERSHTVYATDTTMPGSLVPLVQELTMLRMLQ